MNRSAIALTMDFLLAPTAAGYAAVHTGGRGFQAWLLSNHSERRRVNAARPSCVCAVDFNFGVLRYVEINRISIELRLDCDLRGARDGLARQGDANHHH
jgi:hypothetical protein